MSNVHSVRTVDLVSTQPLSQESATVRGILTDAEAFNAVVPLTRFRFESTLGDQYVYEFLAIDGRHWLQSIDIPSSGEAHQSFNIPDFWKLSEFSLQRSMRDAVIALVKSHGLTLFRVEYA